MNSSFYIGNVEFILEAPCTMIFHNELEQFLKPVMDIIRVVRYHVRFMEGPRPLSFHYVTQIDYPPHIIGNTENGECRIYRDVFHGQPVAMYREINKDDIELVFYKSCPEKWEVELNDLNFMAIERQMIQAEAMILHSSFIVVNEEAILFTAPSGTGKSTQADLWEHFGGATIMNGDRTLLVKTSQGWRAAGFPFSGSSGISRNGAFQIKAVVMIHQAVENEGEVVKSSTAFKRCYPEIVRNYWNAEYEEQVIRLLGELFVSTPGIIFGCNMKKDAVKCLGKILYIRGE